MIKLQHIKTKVTRTYTNKKAELILDNPLLNKEYKVIDAGVKLPDPPEVAKVSISEKKQKNK